MDQITTAQVAEQQRVSVRTVHRMVKDRELIYTAKLPGDTGAYLFDPAEVARAFARRHVVSAPAA